MPEVTAAGCAAPKLDGGGRNFIGGAASENLRGGDLNQFMTARSPGVCAPTDRDVYSTRAYVYNNMTGWDLEPCVAPDATD